MIQPKVNELVKDGKTQSGFWVDQSMRKDDELELRTTAKDFYDQERAMQIALGTLKGFEGELNAG